MMTNLTPNEADRRKKLWCVRVSAETRAKVQIMHDALYGTFTEVVTLAVDRLWLAHYGERASADVSAEREGR
jgi:hypothetical protein